MLISREAFAILGEIIGRSVRVDRGRKDNGKDF